MTLEKLAVMDPSNLGYSKARMCRNDLLGNDNDMMALGYETFSVLRRRSFSILLLLLLYFVIHSNQRQHTSDFDPNCDISNTSSVTEKGLCAKNWSNCSFVNT